MIFTEDIRQQQVIALLDDKIKSLKENNINDSRIYSLIPIIVGIVTIIPFLPDINSGSQFIMTMGLYLSVLITCVSIISFIPDRKSKSMEYPDINKISWEDLISI